MVSGMDTESLVTALVSGYQLKKDNLVKAQTKLSWKQEKWKTMNTSIYSFYSGKLSSARFGKAYSLKKSTVSNSSVATVTASSSAVAGDQTLKVKELASSGYLTGGEVTNKLDKASKITGSSKLSAITNKTSGQGSVTLSVDGKSTNIELTDDMTVNQFIVKLKDAGVQASFDEANQRFFISSKTSGKDGDFSLVANDTDGRDSLYELGLYTDDKTSTAEYEKWAAYYNKADGTYTSALDDIINSAYESNKISFDTVAQEKLAAYSKASATVDSFNTKYMSDTGVKAEDNAKAQLTSKQAQLDALILKGKGGDNDSDFDESKLTDEEKEQYKTLTSSVATLKTDIANYDSAAGVANIAAETADRNTKIKADLTTQYQNKAKNSYDMINATHKFSKGASRKIGQDSEIELNGATFTSNSNNYSINGLTIQVTAKTKDDEQVTITTDTDVDAIYKSIKDMFTDYNKLIKSMDEAYNADSSKGYEPLTDDEKSAMTDDEVEKWETKIKNSLLRKDDTLSSIINTMKNDMASSFTINGKSYALSSFGIATQGYFSSGENEKGVYHIDGDSDDSVSSGNDDKLRAAIASDPETVVSFFSQLATKLYTDLGNKMATSSVSSAYTVYNDKQMTKQYSEYTTKISDAETKITTWEDYYYSKFSAMESALSKLNSQTSSMSGLFGS